MSETKTPARRRKQAAAEENSAEETSLEETSLENHVPEETAAEAATELHEAEESATENHTAEEAPAETAADAPAEVRVEGETAPANGELSVQIQDGAEVLSEAQDERVVQDFPSELPILPLRGLVVYPQTAIPLTVGQSRSIRLVDDAIDGKRLVGLVASHDPKQESPGPDEVFRVGTVAAIHRLFRSPDGTIRLLVQGLNRIRLEEFTATEPYLKARIFMDPEDRDENVELEAHTRTIVDLFTRMAELVPSMPSELVNATLNVDDPLQLVYAVATYMRMELSDAQRVLEINEIQEKLRMVIALLGKELEVLELGRKIQTDAQSEMEKTQKEYFLREQMKAIQRELGEADAQTVEIEEFREKIEAAKMPEEAEKEALRELDRLARLPTAAAEYGVIRTYLDWITSLPWSLRSEDQLELARARQILEEDHYGLKEVKERILEFLAVRKLRSERSELFETQDEGRDYIRREREGAILCFVGPPGVGKTSLGASIARALGRRFIRMSLGGIRDESEIRGFRRTYIGALPGRIIQTIRRAETRNPVVMLDEIDKLGRDFRGDPAAALLEVLDPEQNHEFRDHYLDVAFDLSEALFITTANEVSTIPTPLLDRMEVIFLSGYTEHEKLAIAEQYLVPRQLRENGLLAEELQFTEAALQKIVRDYTREAGVRELERRIGQAARKVATEIAADDSAEDGTSAENGASAEDGEAVEEKGGLNGARPTVTVDVASIPELLKRPPYGYRSELADRTDKPGVATGLAYTAVGGDVLFVEATQMPGKGNFQLTGQLGDVMKESAQAALSYVRAQADTLGVADGFFEGHDIHLHVPAGAVPKDGPSAGVTMAAALASLLTGRPTKANVAMTGEITLRGQVLPVGGIVDKVLAAHRLGADTVLLPQKNETDLEELPAEVREEMSFVFAQEVGDVLDAALEG